MNLLGEKLGPLVLQFPFFSKSEFKTANEFLPRLRLFLKRIHEMPIKFVAEIRQCLERIQCRVGTYRYVVSAATVGIEELKNQFDMVTADFVHVRWLYPSGEYRSSPDLAQVGHQRYSYPPWSFTRSSSTSLPKRLRHSAAQ